MNETRTSIMTAANELFRRQGLNGTSVKQITDAADVTTGSLYHFFPGGKTQLAAEVIETTGQSYRELFEMIADAAPDPVAAVADFFEAAASVLEETEFIDPCPIGTIAREVASTNDRLRRLSHAAFGSWIEAAAARFRSAGLGESDAVELGTCLVAAVEGGLILSRSARDAAPMRAAGRQLTRLVSSALPAGRAVSSTP